MIDSVTTPCSILSPVKGNIATYIKPPVVNVGVIQIVALKEKGRSRGREGKKGKEKKERKEGKKRWRQLGRDFFPTDFLLIHKKVSPPIQFGDAASN